MRSTHPSAACLLAAGLSLCGCESRREPPDRRPMVVDVQPSGVYRSDVVKPLPPPRNDGSAFPPLFTPASPPPQPATPVPIPIVPRPTPAAPPAAVERPAAANTPLPTTQPSTFVPALPAPP